MKKYEITNHSKEMMGITVFRIRALRGIPEQLVRKGDMGGYIESAKNLSQDNNSSWVSGEAVIVGSALVTGDALVMGNSIVSGNCIIRDKARVGNGLLTGKINMRDHAQIYGIPVAVLDGDIRLSGNSMVLDSVTIRGKVNIFEQSTVSGFSIIEATKGCLNLRGETKIRELVHLDVKTTKTLLNEQIYGDIHLSF